MHDAGSLVVLSVNFIKKIYIPHILLYQLGGSIMNLQDFCSGIDTERYVRKFKGPYDPEWAKRTGLVDVEFPNGILLPVATDAIHTLNMLKRYKRANIEEIGSALNLETVYQFFHAQQYLEAFAELGIVKASGRKHNTRSKPYAAAEVANSMRKYSLLEQKLAECSVSNLRAAPEVEERRYLALNIFHGMEYSLGYKNPSVQGIPELLREVYPKV